MTTKTIKFVVQYKYNECGGSDMENLKNNIDHYMKLKGISRYSHLLLNIAHELGSKGPEAYKFADKEKSNFSKIRLFVYNSTVVFIRFRSTSFPNRSNKSISATSTQPARMYFTKS